jgi:hypothetical protein
MRLALPRPSPLPPEPDYLRKLTIFRIILCLALAIVFATFAVSNAHTQARQADPVRASDSTKDSVQDLRLDDIDRSLAELQTQRDTARQRRDTQIENLTAHLADESSRTSRDEGYAAGAFVMLGVLSTLGHIKSKRSRC